MDCKIVVMGASIGGLHALETVLSGFGGQFPVPIAIVQHRGKSSHDRLVELLQQHTRLTVKEAEDKESLCPSTVYLAPADYHLLIDRGSCALSIDAPVNYARPSVDILFDSAADTYGPGVIAVVLTGANADGAQGAARIKESGGIVVVQDANECENSAMPLATMAATRVDCVLKLTEMASYLIDCCQVLEEDEYGSR
jgi:two-component system chemotaxis response regulator CheB